MTTHMKRIVKSTLVAFRQPVIALAVVNVVVALLAFIKDIALAAYAGTSLHADALTLAFFIPDSISNNMFAAAISVVCVPVFSRLAALEQFQRLRLTIRQVSIRFLIISILLMSIAYGFSDLITGWLNGSSNTDLDQATLPLLRLLLPTVVLFVLIAIGTGVLQTLRRFIVPAVAPLLLNLIFLGGVVYCIILGIPVDIGVNWIAIAISLGVCLMAILIVTSWYKAKTQLQVASDLNLPLLQSSSSEDWRDMIRIFIPYVVILFSLQAVYFAERYIITAFDSGTAAALNYAFRLTQFPVWVFVAAISVVILPSLSKHLALGQRAEVNVLMINAFRGVILIVLPSMLFLFLLREPLTAALFQRGAFDARSVLLTSSILEGYSLSVLSQSISLVCLRFFLAERQLTAILVTYVSISLFTISMDIWLSEFMGPRGIGYGAAIGALLNAIIMLYILWRSLRPSYSAIAEEMKLYCKALLMPLLFFPVARVIWFWVPVQSSGTAILFILVTGCMFLLGYFYALRRFWPDLFKSININWERG